MVAAAELVSAQEVGADDAAVRLGDKDCPARPSPIADSVRLAHVGRQREGLAGANGRLQDGPDSGLVGRAGGADQQRGVHGAFLLEQELFCYHWRPKVEAASP